MTAAVAVCSADQGPSREDSQLANNSAQIRPSGAACLFRGTAQQVTFCILPQPLSDLAILLGELAVASRVFEVFVATLGAFG